MMSEYLYKKGVRELFISADRKNIASIKTIEKFGGQILKEYSDIIQYRCDLLVKNKKGVRKR